MNVVVVEIVDWVVVDSSTVAVELKGVVVESVVDICCGNRVVGQCCCQQFVGVCSRLKVVCC